MLLQIRDYIEREKVVSTQQLQREFHLDEQALQPMLAIWVNKKVISPCEAKSACMSRCFGCDSNRPQFYQFLRA